MNHLEYKSYLNLYLQLGCKDLDFKKDNKTKHEEIKAKDKEVKEEIRALVETEATRTSDL